ncbi:MAG: rhombosortase [Acidiferrobacterales bacterium]
MVFTQSASRLVSGRPVYTLLIIGAAVAVYVMPGLPQWLVYERTHLESGQWWRLVSGHWVHFSLAHLVYNTLALAIAGYFIETRLHGRMLFLCLTSAVTTGLSVYWLAPGLMFYGGLSGIVNTTVAYLCLSAFFIIQSRRRWLFVVLLVLLLAKLIAEWITGASLFLHDLGRGVTPVPLAHVAGALTGLLFATAVHKTARAEQTGL